MADEKYLEFSIAPIMDDGSEDEARRVRLFRLPEHLAVRHYGKCSGLWFDTRAGLRPDFRRVTEYDPKTGVPVERVVPSEMDGGRLTDLSTHKVGKALTGIPEDTMEGPMALGEDKLQKPWSRENTEYFKEKMVWQSNHNKFLSSLQIGAEAVNLPDLDNLKDLEGEYVYWRLSPYSAANVKGKQLDIRKVMASKKLEERKVAEAAAEKKAAKNAPATANPAGK